VATSTRHAHKEVQERSIRLVSRIGHVWVNHQERVQPFFRVENLCSKLGVFHHLFARGFGQLAASRQDNWVKSVSIPGREAVKPPVQFRASRRGDRGPRRPLGRGFEGRL